MLLHGFSRSVLTTLCEVVTNFYLTAEETERLERPPLPAASY